MNNKREAPKEKEGKWLTTFNDMVTLLLTFLVLVLSLSEMDKSKLTAASHAIRTVFNMPSLKKEDVSIFTPFVIPIRNKAMIFENKKRKLAERINKALGGPEGIMDARVVKEGISVTIGEKLLFKTGMAEIEKRNNPALKGLCPILKKTVCQIRIEGHTDDVPISNRRFPSNWELSVARAVNVVKYFISEGGIFQERLSAAGYADSRPLFPNVSDHNRNINRRVEVILTLKK
ncbi:MAG: flagellar motor protein MotB [Deltaproteobacteria bacterium]|nr:flagellar motor protein MotB [Deltaproteobacteria bacterium]